MTDLILPHAHARKSLTEPSFRAVESTPLEDGARVLTYLASDETPDRMGDVIKVKGWNLTTYKRNPVVLWGHDTSNVPPIGRAVNVRRSVKQDGRPGLFASVEFAPPEAHEFADTVYQLSKGGYLNAVSVGFMPVEARDATDEEKAVLGMPPYGVIYDRADLLEISVVSVPANPSALISGAKSLVAAGVVNDRTMDRFIKTVPMTEEEMAARLKSKIRGFVDLAANTKAEPGTLSVGDMVRWNNSGGQAEGQIERIVDDGEINVPDSSLTITGTEDDPAALIRLYRDGEPTDTRVGHKFSTLTKVRSAEVPEVKDDEATDTVAVEAVPEMKHIANVQETEETYVITFLKPGVVQAGNDEEDLYHHNEEDRSRRDEDEEEYRGFAGALTHLIDAQAEQARALSTLVDSVSDLTKRIHDYGGDGPGVQRTPVGSEPAPQSNDVDVETTLRSVTETFLNRLQDINNAEH